MKLPSWPVLFVILAACGGPSADRPLTLPLGMSRAELPSRLQPFEYCAGDRTQGETEVFPRCDRVGTDLGASWVVADYDDDTVVRIQRWEKFADDQQGLDRFNALVEQRAKSSAPSDDARGQIAARQELPAGTKTWVAFRSGDTLVGIYLLTPSPPENAQVLEQLIAAQ